jgi:hypothetical protein
VATSDQRAHILAIFEFLAANAARIGYVDARPMKTFTPLLYEQQAATLFAASGTISPDCSEIVTLICRWAGLQDPNASDYDGDGDTETMYDNPALEHYTDAAIAEVGAIVLFGVGAGADPPLPLPDQHAAMVWEPGPDPTLFSHGAPGIQNPTLSEYMAAEPSQRPVTFLKITTL